MPFKMKGKISVKLTPEERIAEAGNKAEEAFTMVQQANDVIREANEELDAAIEAADIRIRDLEGWLQQAKDTKAHALRAKETYKKMHVDLIQFTAQEG